MKPILTSLLFVICFFSTSKAQWVQCNGPYGGSVRAIVKSGSMIYAGLENHLEHMPPAYKLGGFYRSSDQGVSWIKSDLGIAHKSITKFTVMGSTVLEGTDYGLYRSTDNGITWSDVKQIGEYIVISIAATETDVYVSRGNFSEPATYFKSTDKGETWVKIEDPSYKFVSIAVIGTDIFASSYNIGVFKSSDGGEKWKQIYSEPVNKVHTLKAYGTSLFAVKEKTVFRYTDNIWKEVNKGLPGSEIRTLSVGKNALYAVCPDSADNNNEIYSSTDNGDNWTKLNVQIPPETIYCIEEIESNLFIGTKFSGIYRNTVSPGEWSLSNFGLGMKQIKALGVKGSSIVAGESDNRVYRSNNNGNSWDLLCNLGNFGNNITARCFASNSTSLFIGTDKGIFRRSETDGKVTRVDSGLTNRYCQSFCNKGDDLIVGTVGGVFLSTDNGETWSALNQGLSDTTNVFSLVVRGGPIFAGTSKSGIFRCSNYVNGWEKVNNGMTDLNVLCLLEKGTDVFAGTRNGIFRSTDLGESWTSVSPDLDIKAVVTSLAKVGMTLFAAISQKGIYRSTDNGASWSSFNGGLTNELAYLLVSIENTLFAGTFYSSVMKTDVSTEVQDGRADEGNYKMNLSCYPNPTANYITIDRSSLQFPENTPVHYTLSTLVGGRVMEFDNMEAKFTVSLEGMASGVYSLTAVSGGSRAAVMVTVAD